jgi:hypothetical protein
LFVVVVNGRRKLSAKISYRLDINNIAIYAGTSSSNPAINLKNPVLKNSNVALKERFACTCTVMYAYIYSKKCSETRMSSKVQSRGTVCEKETERQRQRLVCLRAHMGGDGDAHSDGHG